MKCLNYRSFMAQFAGTVALCASAAVAVSAVGADQKVQDSKLSAVQLKDFLSPEFSVNASAQYSDNGSSNCQRCHFNPIPKDLRDGTVYLFRLTESHTWAENDRHSKAFELLNCQRGQEMGQRLGWKVTTDIRCLSCHSGWQPDRKQPDEAVLAEGVACEACHGPSSKYINDHSVPQWRSVPLTDRAEQFGMVALREPAQRATVCLSCHIGNAALGRVVTHEMYAAGHPPLPSFELRNFSNSMRHWDDIPDQLARINHARTSEEHPSPDHPNAEALEKTATAMKSFQSQLGVDENTLPGLKTVLTGGVMTLRQSVKLLADEATGNAQNANDAAVWPEFALFDCATCHHDLRYPAWRQTRLTGAAGRPQIPRWPQALVGVAIEQVAAGNPEIAVKMKQQFDALLADLQSPFVKQPFGNPTAIAGPAQRLTAFLDNLLGQMKSLKYDRPAAIAALRQLSDNVLADVPDYDSARQLAWAFGSIYQELKSSNNPVGVLETLDLELDGLDSELHLSLHPLRSEADDVCSQALNDNDLQSTMDRAAAYSPERFRQRFRNLSAGLANWPKQQ